MNDRLCGWANPDDIKNRYYDICSKIIDDESLFATFKRHPDYTPILEHVDVRLGTEYVNDLFDKYDYDEYLDSFLNYLPEFRKNDLIGNPEVHTLGNRWIVPDISPTTMRYVHTLADIDTLGFDLMGKNVVEIGAGYGGQCFVLSRLFDWQSYTIIDLDPVTHLQQKYLDKLGVKNVYAYTFDEFKSQGWGNIDFVMSNYAFSELNRNTQNIFLDEVLRKAKSGYMQCNPGAPESYGPYELRCILAQFQGHLTFKPDSVMSRRYPENFVFAWK